MQGIPMTDGDLKDLLRIGHETSGVEVKGPGERKDKQFLAKVVRAMLGMANRRTGGHVIIGIDDETFKPVEIKDDQLQSWLEYDELSEAVNGYATPSISFEVLVLEHEGKKLVVLSIEEFNDLPILCRQDYQVPQPSTGERRPPTLRRGACYVRSRHKPETAEIRSEEMRELLDLAIGKGVDKFAARARKAGLLPAAWRSAPTDEAEYTQELEDFA
jgi:predicted HTH transcriptional regulator